MKRKLSVIVAIILCFTMLPIHAQATSNSISAADVVSEADALVGKYPYVWGGRNLSDGGFDCSGLIYYVYHTRLGADMTYDQIWRRSIPGEKITDKSNLSPGDVIFGLSGPNTWHTGIYAGNSKMIHASSSSGVSKTSINGNWFTFKFAIRPTAVGQGSSSITAQPCTTHTKGTYLWCEKAHPHYNYFTCSVCGATFTDGTMETLSSCEQCRAVATGRTSTPMVSIEDNSVSISWSYSGSATGFDAYLVQAPWSWEDIKHHAYTTDHSCTFYGVGEGQYQAFVIARPNANDVQSEWAEVNVTTTQPSAQIPPDHTEHTWQCCFGAHGDQYYYTCTVCGQTVIGDIPTDETIVYKYNDFDKPIWKFSPSTATLTVAPDHTSTEIWLDGRIPQPLKERIKNVIVEEGTTSLAYHTFSDMPNLVKVSLPQSLISTDLASFMRCTSLQEISLPKNLSSFGWSSFLGCSALKNVYVDPQNNCYCDIDGVLFSKDKAEIVCCPYGRTGSYTIPDGVTTIGEGAFKWCEGLDSVTIPSSVTSINEIAFCGSPNKPQDGTTFRGVLRVYAGSYGETYAKARAKLGLQYEIINPSANTGNNSVPAAGSSAAGLRNFTKVQTYTEGSFRDVKADAWYAENIATAYKLGLMRGTGAGTFSPGNNITIAEAVTLAARLHSIYYTGGENFETFDAGNWYDPYVNYVKEAKLLAENYNYDQPATREEFVHILAQAFPKEALPPVLTQIPNYADAGSIIYQDDVNLMSLAGVITGSSSSGSLLNFLPKSTITRAEVAAIATRMTEPELRIG